MYLNIVMPLGVICIKAGINMQEEIDKLEAIKNVIERMGSVGKYNPEFIEKYKDLINSVITKLEAYSQ